MKNVKKIVVGCLALITFSVITGVTPVAQNLIGAETAEAAVPLSIKVSVKKYSGDNGYYVWVNKSSNGFLYSGKVYLTGGGRDSKGNYRVYSGYIYR